MMLCTTAFMQFDKLFHAFFFWSKFHATVCLW